MDSAINQIEQLIKSWKRGRIFFQIDFADIASSDAIRQSLSRLCKAELIIRVARGIYCYPVKDTALGLGIIYPTMEEVAKAVAKNEKERIVPTGISALNMLGLSSQVPMNVIYVTDGAPRHISLGKGKGITFQHTSEVKRLAFKSEVMSLIAAALREIGEENITPAQMSIVKKHLENVTEEELDHDIKLIPVWLRTKLLAL